MEKISFHRDFEIASPGDNGSAIYFDLLRKAEDAMQNAYAPYSKFHVGAAVLLDDGTVVTGSNQENAAYPSGLCAERVAVFHAMSAYPGRKVTHVAIASGAPDSMLIAPCGACRQVLLECEKIAGQPVMVILRYKEGKVLLVRSVSDLLPLAFSDFPPAP